MVLYTSVDRPFSDPVLAAFTRETGISVDVVYDTEANKSRGLAQRILAEAGHAQADVFWNSEIMQTLWLRKAQALEAYRSPGAEGIPATYRDPDGYWTGFAARFRVLVYRKGTPPPAQSVFELTEPRWKGKVAMAQPLFGSTMTEAAALFQVLGPERARVYYRARRANDTFLADGNSVSAEATASGEVLIGQTDADDAFLRGGEGLVYVFPDQKGIGTLMIPNTVTLVRGAPHREAGRKLIDFLLQPSTEEMLARGRSHQLPLHTSVHAEGAQFPPEVRQLAQLKRMKVDYPRLIDHYEEVDLFLRDLFLQ